MHFEQELDKLAIPEWKTQYIRYNDLKRLLNRLIESNYTAEERKTLFVKALTSMVSRVNRFYVTQAAMMTNTWNVLKQELEKLEPPDPDEDEDDKSKRMRQGQSGSFSFGRRRKMKRRRSTILSLVFPTGASEKKARSSVEEFYLALDKLMSYVHLNRTAVKKILKKFDKNMQMSIAEDTIAKFDDLPVFKTTALTELEKKIIDKYTIYFTDNSRRDAMARLRVPNQRFHQCPWNILGSGFMLGITAICIVVLGIAMANIESIGLRRARQVALFHIFRGLFVIALFPLLLSADFYIFGKMGINFRLLMRMSQRNQSTLRLWEWFLFWGSFSLAVCGLASVASVFSPYIGDGAVSWGPAFAIMCIMIAMIDPLTSLDKRKLPKPLHLVGRIVMAPSYEVRFTDFWAADQLTSLVRPMLDLEYAVFYYIWAFQADSEDALQMSLGHTIVRGMFASLPSVWRLMQCIRRFMDDPLRRFHPHLTNGCKYSTTFPVIWFSLLASHFKGDDDEEIDNTHAKIFFTLWIIAAVVNMSFTLAWDFWMDWGILRSIEEPLRANIMFPRHVYFGAIAYNIVGRAAWVLTVSVGFFNSYSFDFLGLGLAVVEILRRSSWNLFRFEIEHLFNCGKLRATTLEISPQDMDVYENPSSTKQQDLLSELYLVDRDEDTNSTDGSSEAVVRNRRDEDNPGSANEHTTTESRNQVTNDDASFGVGLCTHLHTTESPDSQPPADLVSPLNGMGRGNDEAATPQPVQVLRACESNEGENLVVVEVSSV